MPEIFAARLNVQLSGDWGVRVAVFLSLTTVVFLHYVCGFDSVKATQGSAAPAGDEVAFQQKGKNYKIQISPQ